MIEQKYKDQIRQAHKREMLTVDEELLLNKFNKKLFRKVAYGFGIGVGLFILIPILPEIIDEQKSGEIKSIFSVFAVSLILYSIVISFSFFFLRSHIKLVLFMLNWFIMPMIGIWGVVGLMDALK